MKVSFWLISFASVAAVEHATFETLDANGDGKLSLKELQHFADTDRATHFDRRRSFMLNQNRKRVEKNVEHLDKDGDGLISLHEFPEGAPIRDDFHKLDHDGDGKIDGEGLMDYMKMTHSKESIAKNSVKIYMEAADDSGDGHVTKEEFDNHTGDLITSLYHGEL
jgi:Ca2+-binding EF-hand superfamily protein